jgi:predicted ester cyclase
MLDDSCITHQLATGETRPVEFEVEACEIWHRSFDDVQISIEQVVAEHDRVAVYWLLKSTHAREFMGIEAKGKRVYVPGMEINRMANGKIVEIWRLSDTMSLMQQLEAV